MKFWQIIVIIPTCILIGVGIAIYFDKPELIMGGDAKISELLRANRL